jgi:hypothetical protein
MSLLYTVKWQPAKVIFSAMAYRDDLEAAHARIAALEAENEQLRAELERVRAAPAAKPIAKAMKTIEIDAASARDWGEMTALQAEIVSENDRTERARLMRRLAELRRRYYNVNDTAALELRRGRQARPRRLANCVRRLMW